MYRSYPAFLLLLMCCSCDPAAQVPDKRPAAAPDTAVAEAVVAAHGDTRGIPPAGNLPEDFVPHGYFIQHSATGDLNEDGLEDVTMILRQTEDSTSARAFVVLIKQQGKPAYRLADTGWEAIGAQCNADGFRIRYSEDLEVKDGNICLKLYEPGAPGNLFTTYRYMDGQVRLTEIETFGQGAGAASGIRHNLLTGIVEVTEINRMKEPEEVSKTTDTTRPETILLHDSRPDEYEW